MNLTLNGKQVAGANTQQSRNMFLATPLPGEVQTNVNSIRSAMSGATYHVAMLSTKEVADMAVEYETLFGMLPYKAEGKPCRIQVHLDLLRLRETFDDPAIKTVGLTGYFSHTN